MGVAWGDVEISSSHLTSSAWRRSSWRMRASCWSSSQRPSPRMWRLSLQCPWHSPCCPLHSPQPPWQRRLQPPWPPPRHPSWYCQRSAPCLQLLAPYLRRRNTQLALRPWQHRPSGPWPGPQSSSCPAPHPWRPGRLQRRRPSRPGPWTADRQVHPGPWKPHPGQGAACRPSHPGLRPVHLRLTARPGRTGREKWTDKRPSMQP
mmetsp:Transcript_72009/g.224540  ORF Transcript_72009/g.224540 Transcript_72009/m.224540 type:complete len:204 (+) Transcript_72009:356-967(+)